MNVSRILAVTALALSAYTFISISLAAGTAPSTFVLHKTPKSVVDVAFKDGEGRGLSLSHFKGKLVLLNIWATWCAPCRKEMPTLDHLQKELGGSNFEVVALSIDRAGAKAVRKFYDDIKIKHLKLFINQPAASMRQLRIYGLPSTLLLDREGRELGRLIGPTEWDTPEMVTFLRDQIAKVDNVRVDTGFRFVNYQTQENEK